MGITSVSNVLLGHSRTVSTRLVTFAIGLFVLLFGSATLVGPNNGVFLLIATGYNALFLAIVLVCLAGLCGYVRSGVLVACLLTFAPLFALFVSGVGTGFATDPITPLRLLVAGTEGALLYGVPLGVVGFLLGAGIRRVTRFR